MSDFEDFETELIARYILGPGEHPAIDLAYARLIAAMQLQCGGAEDCRSCTLSGFHVCIFEHGRQEPPAAVMATTVA